MERERERSGYGPSTHLPRVRRRRLIEFPPSFKSGKKGLAIYSTRRMRLLSSVRATRGEADTSDKCDPTLPSADPSGPFRVSQSTNRSVVAGGKFGGSRHFHRFYALLKRHVTRSYRARLRSGGPFVGLRSITVVEFYAGL